MAARRKKKPNPEILWEQDEVLISLKERYFKLLKKEVIGVTKNYTAILDKLEIEIEKRKNAIINENN